MNEYRLDFLLENHIRYDFSRRSSGRMISLARQEDVGNDGHDDDDGVFGISPPLSPLRENTRKRNMQAWALLAFSARKATPALEKSSDFSDCVYRV